MFELIEIPNNTEYRCKIDDEENFWIKKVNNEELIIGAYPKEIEEVFQYFRYTKHYHIENLTINKEIFEDYGEILLQFKVKEQTDLKTNLQYAIYKHKLKNINNENIIDAINFFKKLGYYNILHETELAYGKCCDEVCNTIIEIEKIAQKYELYDEEESCNNTWYHDHILLPKMQKFFKKILEMSNREDVLKISK